MPLPPPISDKKNIAQHDQKMMDLQSHIEAKKKQLKQDYQRLQKDVKQNPYLTVAIEAYKTFFEAEKNEKRQKKKALTTILKHIEQQRQTDNQYEINRDIIEIKRKIKQIEQ